MKVRYGNYRINGENMTGKEVEMTEDEARPLMASNIAVEVATAEPPENAMLKRPNRRRKYGIKAKNGTINRTSNTG